MHVNKASQIQFARSTNRRVQRAFTLIELIVGIVIFAVAMVFVISVLQPQVKKGIDPIWQVRAASLGQSLSSEIRAKSFDQFSNRVGGMDRCNESVSCTTSSGLGPDSSENRGSFNDVDDYDGLDVTGAAILNSLGLTTNVNGINIYAGFRAQVSVFYDQNLDGINDDDLDQDGSLDSGTLVANKKLVTVTITTPGGERITMTSIKGNF
ncbi:MAG: MSHA pilin protein MshD [Gammaproteobacteria bacterium]|jgi:MSHA pilin protein MshD